MPKDKSTFEWNPGKSSYAWKPPAMKTGFKGANFYIPPTANTAPEYRYANRGGFNVDTRKMVRFGKAKKVETPDWMMALQQWAKETGNYQWQRYQDEFKKWFETNKSAGNLGIETSAAGGGTGSMANWNI